MTCQTKTIFICVPGLPIAKGRPKFARRGNFVTTYTPEKTRDYEAIVAAEAVTSMRGEAPLKGPLELTMQIFLPIPTSYSKKKAQACREQSMVPTKTPDWENVAKSVCDAFNGIVWDDDSQIVDAHVSKRFADTACVIAIVTPLDLQSC